MTKKTYNPHKPAFVRGPYRKWDYQRGGLIPHKSAIVMLRVSPEEKALWTAAAEHWMGSLSDWLRKAADRSVREYEEAQAAARATAKTPRKRQVRLKKTA